jgi:hypothetical protein
MVEDQRRAAEAMAALTRKPRAKATKKETTAKAARSKIKARK